MKRVALTAALAVIVTLPMVSGEVAFAQNQSDPQTLRREIEQRFEVLPLRSSVVLTPKDGSRRRPLDRAHRERDQRRRRPGHGRGASREARGGCRSRAQAVVPRAVGATDVVCRLSRHAGRGRRTRRPSSVHRVTPDEAVQVPAAAAAPPASAAWSGQPRERPRPVRRQRHRGRRRDGLRRCRRDWRVGSHRRDRHRQRRRHRRRSRARTERRRPGRRGGRRRNVASRSRRPDRRQGRRRGRRELRFRGMAGMERLAVRPDVLSVHAERPWDCWR